MMEAWEAAEITVERLTGGRRTPGSGNGPIKGDVRTANWIFEVKQTSQPQMTFESDWLRQLLLHKTRKSLAICLFFGYTGFVYYYSRDNGGEGTGWATRTLTSDNLPETIVYDGTVWELDSIESLRRICKQDGGTGPAQTRTPFPKNNFPSKKDRKKFRSQGFRKR